MSVTTPTAPYVDDVDLSKLPERAVSCGNPHCVFIAAENPQVIALPNTVNLENYIIMSGYIVDIPMGIEKIFKPCNTVILDTPRVVPVIH